MQFDFLKKFRRITYSTNYLPEIDGLRFLAIFSVVVIMHITHYLDEKFYNNQLIPYEYWRKFSTEGGNGVALFFIISGFILSLPFAKWRLNKGRRISLKNYYLRRVTRLEPPYIIILIICFVAYVWMLHIYSFKELLPHFFASLFYLHGLIYNHIPLVLPVAWSLEVEVQFYILAPLFFLIFLIRNRKIRWLICITIIVCNSIYWFDVWEVSHVFMCLHFFFTGILLADLYCSKINLFKNQKIGLAIGIASIAGFIFIPSLHHLAGNLLKLLCMFIMIHTALTNQHVKKIFSAKAIVLIGGMCYSIYLLHFAVVSFLGKLLLHSGIDLANKNYFIPFVFVFAFAVLVVCAAFFILVEKPFMKPFGIHKTKTSQ